MTSGNITSHPTKYVHILAISLVAKSIMILGQVLVHEETETLRD